ncbi:hypothetical protein [Seonamhaeicola marinus]|uniref:DUF4294 domain-containing protein n=1 Tax=Seonamhaeicola marinus TaxID=1912246 RepID=A0A5D0HPD3_9FLAO|nr:hypothetical protein [Seonamhaeicola marinus]TYA71927.1 hypothetical protein FUA24_20475 [Seonamhaeicola marinus]
MRLLYVIIIVTALSFNAEAQDNQFVFSKDFNALMVQKEGSSPYVYEILHENATTTIRKPREKRLTSYYKKALYLSKKAKTDSSKIATLKQQGKSLEDINKVINVKDVYDRLKMTKRVLKSAKKYEIVPSKVIVEKKDKFKMRRTIFKPQNVIIGTFEGVGAYYVVKKTDVYNQGELISIAEAKQNNLSEDSFLFANVFELIKNVDTGDVYMVYPNFLKNYPINKAKSKSTFGSTIDKKINASILAYHKKRIVH